MVKKIVIVSLAVVAGLFLVSRTPMASYCRTAWNQISQSAEEAVPLEFEIERIRTEIAQLGPDMHGKIKLIADEIVKVENLRKDVGELRVAVGKQRDNVLTLKKDVSAGTKLVSFKGREYSTEKAKDQLQREFDSYKRAESTLRSKESLLEAKETALSAAREQLASMRAKKEELEVAVAQLEAEVKTLRVAQTKSDIQLDDTRLSDIKNAVSKLKDRLRKDQVQNELLNNWKEGTPAPVTTKAQSAELLKEIDEHFGAAEVDVVDKQ